MISRTGHASLHVEVGRKAVGEDLERSVGASVFHWLIDDLESGLRERRAVPGAVKRDEGSVSIMRWERGASVEEQRVGRPVSGKVRHVALLRVATADLLAVAAVLGRQHLFLLLWIEVAVRPTEIIAAPYVEELLRWQLGTLLIVVEIRPIGARTAELVTTMLRYPEVAVVRIDRDADCVSNATGKVLSLRLGLVELACVEPPDAGAHLELGAWIHARYLELAIVPLTGIGSGTEIDVERAVTRNGEGLRAMAHGRQTGDHLLHVAGRRQ